MANRGTTPNSQEQPSVGPGRDQASMDGRREQTIKATATLTPIAEHKGTRVTSKSVRCVSLLPVRYALGDAPSRTPDLAGPFQIEGVTIPGTTGTNYTLRRQRPGYLYIFHEKYQGWSLFRVEPGVRFEGKLYNGGLFKEITNPEPGYEGVHLRSTIHGLLLVEEDDPIWICFSNYKWSPRILANNRKDPKLRDTHMRYFNPLNWSGQKHMSTLSEAAERVADLKSGLNASAFWFSNTDFFQLPPSVLRKTLPASRDSKQHPSTTNWKPAPPSPEVQRGQARMAPASPSGSYRVPAGTMVDQMGRLIPPPAPPTSTEKRPATPEETYVPTQPELDRGVLIALDDPVGIVMDFRCLMASRLNRFMTEPERARRISCYHAVNTLKANFLSIGEKRYWEEKPRSLSRAPLVMANAAEEAQIDRQARQMGVNPVQTPAYQASFTRRRQAESAYDNTIQSKVKAARDAEWAPYHDKVNWDALNRWPEKLSKQFEGCQIQELDPLAEAHAAWMQSAHLDRVFKYHFHSSDMDKDGKYAELARLCIEGTQGWKACRDLYGQWVRAESLAPGNILIRAFLNNDAQLLAEARQQPASWSLSFNTFMKKVILSVYKQWVKDAAKITKDQHKALAGELQSVFSDLLGECMEKDKGHLSLSILAAAESVDLRLVVYKDTNLAEVIQSLAASVQEANPGISSAASKTAVLRMLNKCDPKLLGDKTTTKWVFAFDDAQMPSVGASGTAQGAIRALDELAMLPQSRWECFKASGGRASMIGLICQTTSLWSSIKSFKDAPLWKSTEEGGRLIAGVVSWVSTLATSTYHVTAPEIALGLNKAMHFTAFKILGVIGAGVNGVVDVCKAVQAYKNNDLGMMWIYGISAVSGIVSSLLLSGLIASSWVPMVGWAMLCLFIGIQVAIAAWNQGKVQDWFKHCAFGTEPGFKDGIEEQSQLNAAMGWT